VDSAEIRAPRMLAVFGIGRILHAKGVS